ncbi:DUF1415 domain-containing protein [Nitrosomonas sp.]|uniref:DUF1415 domain-containing protein n=1 Tax=Nitrosomonas sp. TaxID=42353 RepID=UPI0025EC7455|nr:DUF1415 domain-containing protein [Nitrosomonas sp.]MBY0484454.1 DUF1415 domain-containing protein [Nitrosomonas sp.]
MDIATNEKIIVATKLWLERAVIGLNLCPFAKAVRVKNQISYIVSSATTHEDLLNDLMHALEILAETSAEDIDTTLLVHPYVLTDFLDYNDFLSVADLALEDMGLENVLQVASFHPQYQFSGTQPDDIENYTNRSPYPMMHLLREASVMRAVLVFPEAGKIFDKNIATLRDLGHAGWNDLGLVKINPPLENKSMRKEPIQ